MSLEQPENPLSWRRPASAPPAPHVWARHEDAAGRRYRVQDATPDLHAALLDMYAAEYACDEATSKDLKLSTNEVSMAEYHFMASCALEQGASLAVLEERAEGAEPEIVGGMILPVLSIHDDVPECQGRVLRVQMGMNTTLRSAPGCSPLERTPPLPLYACDLGLWVRRDRRRCGLGAAILGAVVPVCAALGIPHFSTLFTSAQSQRLAVKTGLKEMSRLRYSDVLDGDKPAFSEHMPETHCLLMGTDIN